MRSLKTLYPCKGCGEPARVGHTRDAEHAVCALCATLSSYASTANWSSKRADDWFKKHNESVDDAVLLAAMIAPAVGYMAEAVAAGLMVARLTLRDPRNRSSWIRWAHSRSEWLENVSSQLREMTAGERTAFSVINGGLALVEAPQ